MSDDQLNEIEEIVDSFCDTSIEIINNRVVKNDGISRSASSTSASTGISTRDHYLYRELYLGEFHTEESAMVVQCYCGISNRVEYIKSNPEYNAAYNAASRMELETSEYYCPGCGRMWKINGRIMKLEADLGVIGREENNDRYERRRERYF